MCDRAQSEATRTRIAVGHGHGMLLVAGVDKLHAALVKGDEEVNIPVAHHAEHTLGALGNKRVGQGFVDLHGGYLSTLSVGKTIIYSHVESCRSEVGSATKRSGLSRKTGVCVSVDGREPDGRLS